jgi:hypothetical protein
MVVHPSSGFPLIWASTKPGEDQVMVVHPSSGFPLIWASTKPGEDHTAEQGKSTWLASDVEITTDSILGFNE